MPLYRKDNIALIENLKAFAIIFCASHLPVGSMFPELSSIMVVLGGTGVPLFVMLSAYFMKSGMMSPSTAFIENLISMILWVSGVGFLVALVLNKSGWAAVHVSYFWSIGQFYLALLIIWKIILPYALSLHRWILFLGVAVLFIGINFVPPEFLKIDFPYAFAHYTPFFFMGCFLTWEKIVRFRDSQKKHYILIFTLPIVAAGFATAIIYPEIESGLLFVIRRFFISISVILLLFAYFPGYKIGILHRLGTKSLVVYIFHFLLLAHIYGRTIYPAFIEGKYPELVVSLITFSVYILTLYLLSMEKLYKWFFNITNFVRKLIFKVS